MTLERKIESALEAHFRAEGWLLDTVQGDHLACIGRAALSITINLTECAKAIAVEIEKC